MANHDIIAKDARTSQRLSDLRDSGEPCAIDVRYADGESDRLFVDVHHSDDGVFYLRVIASDVEKEMVG